MRNGKLRKLTDAAFKAQSELTEYLRHLDARETDANYVLARMLFEEGWRVVFNLRKKLNDSIPAVQLWKPHSAEGSVGADVIGAQSTGSKEIFQALQLPPTNESEKVIGFIIELTSEIGDVPPVNKTGE